MRKSWQVVMLAALVAVLAQAAEAVPLRLDYAVSPLGAGLFDYEFTLVVDDNDGTYLSGQGWRWLIFGDAPFPGPSPLTDFVGDPSDLPIGPWTAYGSSSGGHNGPTLLHVADYWVPSGVGDSLHWSGTSTADLAQGELLWSTIAGTLREGVPADFEEAHRVVPEPATLLLLGGGLLALTRVRRRS